MVHALADVVRVLDSEQFHHFREQVAETETKTGFVNFPQVPVLGSCGLIARRHVPGHVPREDTQQRSGVLTDNRKCERAHDFPVSIVDHTNVGRLDQSEVGTAVASHTNHHVENVVRNFRHVERDGFVVIAVILTSPVVTRVHHVFVMLRLEVIEEHHINRVAVLVKRDARSIQVDRFFTDEVPLKPQDNRNVAGDAKNIAMGHAASAKTRATLRRIHDLSQ
mmetsp:Transcript_125/g.461  ORF Transcript_125/g.461 Transcript_125/m.461 type:complete len:222 (-) Transcript_125:18-683(-)